MKQILKLVFLLVIGQTAFGQAPSNYTNINGRYRWIAGMFDSTFHIPKGSTPSLRTGGSTNSGGLFYNTSDSSVYTYTGTQWIKLRGVITDTTSLSNRINLKLNISDTASMLSPYLRKIDTTNKYVTQVYKKNASDSVFYVKGGNHIWAFNDSTGSPGGGGGGKVYYFNGGVNMGTFGGYQMYELGDTANTGTAANFTRATTGNIANFITDPNKPGLLQIPAGVWSVDAWLSETGGGSNHAEIYIIVEKWNGSTITAIATSPIEQITEGSTPNLYSWSVSIPTTSLTVTDRIIIQFYIQNTNGKTVTLYTQNGYIGEVHTTFTTGIGAINGLTAPAQYLVTGTSGTDFNINSTTATHTFNLPTASATNRGALSTTDWTTFNSKLSPADTVSLSNRINLKLNISDTAAMLSPYARTNVVNAGLATKVNISDTATMLSPYARKNFLNAGTGISYSSTTGTIANTAPDQTVALNAGTGISISGTYPNFTITNSSPSSGGTVTSVGSNTGTGLTGGPITTSGTLAIDTLLVSTRAWRQKGIDSVQANLTTGLATKLNISDTASMLSPYARTNVVNAGLALKVNISDTASMLTPYLRKIDTTSMLSPYLRSNVAAATYVPQTRTITINGTSQDLSANRTFNVGTVTSVGITAGTGISVANSPVTGSGNITVTNTAPDQTVSLSAGTGISIAGTYPSFTITNSSPSSGGTVTSVGSNSGTGLTGGPITGSGTLAIDTALISTRAWRQKGVDSVASLINTRISGTTNYIPKFTSSSAIGNSQIFDNGTNVGIGTTTPSDPQGYGGALDIQNATYGGVIYLRKSSATTTYGFFGYDQSALAATIAAFGANNKLQFNAGTGAIKMTLDASGNLGLGVSPSAWARKAIQIGDAAQGYVVSNTRTGFAVNMYYDGNNKYIENNYAALYAQDGTSGQHQWFIAPSGSANGTISFTQAMTLDASGRLGIGVTNMSSYNAGGNQFVVGGGEFRGLTIAGTTEGNIFFADGTTGAETYRGTIGYNHTGDYLYFFSAATERMRLDASGNLGLGVTPSAWSTGKAFEVGALGNSLWGVGGGDIMLGSNFYYNTDFKYAVANYATAYRQQDGVHKWLISSSGTANAAISFTQAMTLDAAGTLFIGKTNSVLSNTTGISLGGGGIFAHSSSGNGYIDLGATRASVAANIGGVIQFRSVYRNSDSDNTTIAFIKGLREDATNNLWRSYLSFETTNTDGFTISEKMRITSGGNVGIGTSSPYAGTNVTSLTVNATAYPVLALQIGGTFKGGVLGYSDHIDLYSEGYLNFSTNATERMRITSGGLVGIGTSAPSYKLDIESSSGLIETIRIKNGYTGGSDGSQLLLGNSANFTNAYFRLNGGGNSSQAGVGSLNIGLTESAPMAFYTANSERMRITSGGNVGIGDNGPSSKLQVAGDVRISGAGTAIDGYDGGFFDYASSTFRIRGQNNTGGAISFMTSANGASNISTERMRITSGGEVYIGTTSDVSGVGKFVMNYGSDVAWGIIVNNTYTATGNVGYFQRFYNNGYEIGGFNAGNASTDLLNIAGRNGLKLSTDGPAGAIERMRITSGGNVGIGTNSPTDILNLSYSNNNGGNVGLYVKNTNTGTTANYAGLYAEAQNGTVGFRAHATTTTALGGYGVTGTSTAHPLLFVTSDAERMRITSGGELLINTTSDAGDYKLQVNGNGLFAGRTKILGGAIADDAVSGNNIGIGFGSSSILSIDGSGNLSTKDIGTSANPWGSLYLNGTIKTGAPSGGTAKPWKLGEAGVAIGGSDGYAVKVEIDGTLYYLMTAYLPEPAPEAMPTAGPAQPYSTRFEQPVMKIRTDNQKVKDLEKEVAELKEMVKKLASK